MRKNILIGALGLAIVALVVLTVHQCRRAGRLVAEAGEAAERVQVEADAQETKTPPITAGKQAAYEQQIAQLQEQLDAASAGQERNETEPRQEQPAKGAMGNLAEMLKDPGMKDVVRAQQKSVLDFTHASLYSYLNLPPEKLEAFKGLLLERQLAFMDVGLEMMDGSLSAEEKRASSEFAGKLTKEYDAKLHELLGEENAEIFDQFEETQAERAQVNLFKQALAGVEPLTQTQEHDLIMAMHEERMNYSLSAFSEDPTGAGGTVSEEESIRKQMEGLAALHEQHVARAAEILTEAQLRQFRASLEQQLSMQEMGLRMASQMLGTAPAGGEE
jgi:hypothetical protein